MATRTLEIDLRQGTGASSEPMYGIVTVQRVKVKSTGGFVVLPFETSLKLVDGKATITQAVTDGTGPMYDSAYLFRVQNGYCGQRYGFMAALPDGTTPITTGELPMVDPITGEGIYMDAQEWNELYGDLPDRVISLEGSQTTQNTQIASLQTGKANTAHAHVIGDVTGLQTALNAKGNATMRVDTSVGTRVFISDGTTERMISADTGWRKVTVTPLEGSIVASGTYYIRRVGDSVTMRLEDLMLLPGRGAGYILTGIQQLPNGFRGESRDRVISGIGLANNAVNGQMISVFGDRVYWCFTMSPSGNSIDHPTTGLAGSISWTTSNAWPTTLPGIPA